MRTASIGHGVFAALFITLGVLGLIEGDFMPVWSPVPDDLQAHDALAYASAVLSLLCGVGLLIPRTAAAAAGVLLAALLSWVLAFRVRTIVNHPTVFGAWDGCAETVAIVAGAWALFARFASVRVVTGDTGVRLARVLYGLVMVPFGIAHLRYVDDTAALVPGWLPAHVPWVYGTAVAFIAAGAAILTGVCARLAAALSAAQIAAFTLLVWVPIVARGSANTFQWSELGISAALAAAGWVVADSYRGVPWLAVRKR